MASRPKPRAFLDTNVIFSALYSDRGAPAVILAMFVKGNIDVVVSQQVLEEVVRTIKEKLPDALPSLMRFLTSTPPDIVANPPVEEVNRWTEKLSFADAAVFAASVRAGVDYFVTGDGHFTRQAGLGEAAGVRILTPAEFVKFPGNRIGDMRERRSD